jgi:hypothetical protein
MLKSAVSATKGWRLYALALLFALPDILDGLGVIDWSQIFPEGVAAKVGMILAITRVVFGLTIRKLQQLSRGAEEEVERIEQNEEAPK